MLKNIACVFFLQDCPLETNQLNIIVSRFDYKAYCSLVNIEQPGIAIIYLEALGPVEILPLESGCLLFTKINDNMPFINIYAPSGNDNKYARKVLFFMKHCHRSLGLAIQHLRLTESICQPELCLLLRLWCIFLAFQTRKAWSLCLRRSSPLAPQNTGAMEA